VPRRNQSGWLAASRLSRKRSPRQVATEYHPGRKLEKAITKRCLRRHALKEIVCQLYCEDALWGLPLERAARRVGTALCIGPSIMGSLCRADPRRTQRAHHYSLRFWRSVFVASSFFDFFNRLTVFFAMDFLPC
jgi:hypothetical protein